MSRRNQTIAASALLGGLLLTCAILVIRKSESVATDGHRSPNEDAVQGGTSHPALAKSEVSAATPDLGEAKDPRRAMTTEARLSVKGRTEDRRGNPAGDGLVTIQGPSGFKQTVRVGHDGEFSFNDLSAGAFVLAARGFPRFLPKEQSLTLTTEGSDQSVRLVLDACPHVPIRFVTATGEPLWKSREGVEAGWLADRMPGVIATKTPPSAELASMVPEEGHPFLAGVFRRGGPPPADGTIEFLAPLPLYLSAVYAGRILETRRVDSSEEQVFVIDPHALEQPLATIDFVVADAETGAPIAAKYAYSIARAWDHERSVVSRPTDSEGRAHLEGLGPGAYLIRFDVDGYQTRMDLIRASPGQNDLGILKLRRGSCIHGTIVDEEGAPVQADVYIGGRKVDDSDIEFGLGSFSGIADKSVFIACNVPHGDVLIGVRGDGWAANPTTVHVDQDPMENLKIVARWGARVDLEPASDEDVILDVRIANSSGTIIWEKVARPSDSYVVCLLPGPYEAITQWLRSGTRTQTFEVQSKGLRIELTPSAK